MKIISLPEKWMSAYEPIEYKFQKEIPLAVDNSATYLGLVASTLESAYYKLSSYGIAKLLSQVGDRIYLYYCHEDGPEFGPIIWEYNFTIRGFDSDGNPILETKVGTLSGLPPGTLHYKPFSNIYNRASKIFRLYAGFPAWHPKNSIRDINSLVAELDIPANLNFEYVVRVDAFLQGLLSNPAPYIGDDERMYIGFKLVSIDEFEMVAGGVYYCLNSTTPNLDSSEFVSSHSQLTEYKAVKFNPHYCLVSKIIDDSIINQLL